MAPYQPSWQDRLQERLERGSVPPLVGYLLMWALPLLALTLAGWLTGATPTGRVSIFYVNLWTLAVATLVIIHLLDRSAVTALERFRPALDATPERLAELRYRLTRLPARKALVAAFLGVAAGATEVVTMPADVRSTLGLFATPLTATLEVAFFLAAWTFFITFVHHTFHQLNVVRRIYRDHTQVNLFRLDPLYSFSWLTARTALGIALIPFSFHLTSTRLYGGEPKPEWLLLVVGIALVAGVLFVWPLLGIHNVLEVEKVRLAREAAVRLEAAIGELHAAADRREYANMDALNKLISSLVLEQAAIEKISTWPWKPETPRLLATALLLPLAVYVGQRLLTGTLGF